MKSTFTLGLVLAIAIIILDQASKWWLLGLMDAHDNFIPVFSWFNLTMVWNQGVSFGMFAHDSAWTRWILVGVAVIISGIMTVILWKTKSRFMAVSLGLIIGGALGNVIDRVRFGAVADFFDVHAYGYHWPAFNVADSCIFIGVVLLCLEEWMESRRGKEKHA